MGERDNYGTLTESLDLIGGHPSQAHRIFYFLFYYIFLLFCYISYFIKRIKISPWKLGPPPPHNCLRAYYYSQRQLKTSVLAEVTNLRKILL